MAKTSNRQGTKKRRVQLPSEVAHARAAITRQGDIRRGLAQFKVGADRLQVRKVLPRLLEQRPYHQLIWPDITPRTYAKLASAGLPGHASIDVEVEWVVHTLKPHASLLNEFIRIKEASDRALLLGDRESYLGCIDKAEEQFGLSIWLLQARFNAIAITEGLARQKEYTQRILNERSLSYLVKYIIGWISFRAERNISANEFQKILSESLPLGGGFAELTHVILGEAPPMDEEQAGQALAFTDLLPLMDRYFYMLAVTQAFVAGTANRGMLAAIGDSLSLLRKRVSDPALEKLIVACGGSRAANPNVVHMTNIIDLYSLGDAGGAMALAAPVVLERGSIDALQIYLRAARLAPGPTPHIPVPEASLLSEIATDLERLMTFSADAPEAAARLSKIALTHCNSPWAATLSLVTRRQARDERIFAPERQQILNALRSNESNPIHSFCFEAHGTASEVLNDSVPANVDSVTGHVTNALLKREIDTPAVGQLTPAHQSKVRSILALRTGKPAVAIEILTPIYNAATLEYERFEAGLQLSEALLRSNQLLICADVCAEMFMANPYLGALLPVKRLVNALIAQEELTDRQDFYLGRLSVVIVFDIYSRHVSPARDSERADAFRDLLRSRGVKYASEFATATSGLPTEQVIHFLRFVCVPEVLDQSLALKSTREVEEERAKILVLLNDLISRSGRTPPTELIEELQEIRTSQVIRETTLQLDQSKIYVDTQGIKKLLGSQIRESWNRYRLLTIHGDQDSKQEDIYRSLETVLGEKFAVVGLSLPVTERNKLYERMIGDIRDQFASSKVFGLNANLSTNIRHGYVLREIRKPFVSSHLVTNKLTESGDYRSNAYWLSRMEANGSNEIAASEALNRLSAAVDEEIELLIGRLLRIKSEQVPEGLFDYILLHPQIQYLQRFIDEFETHDEFFDYIFALYGGSPIKASNVSGAFFTPRRSSGCNPHSPGYSKTSKIAALVLIRQVLSLQ